MLPIYLMLFSHHIRMIVDCIELCFWSVVDRACLSKTLFRSQLRKGYGFWKRQMFDCGWLLRTGILRICDQHGIPLNLWAVMKGFTSLSWMAPPWTKVFKAGTLLCLDVANLLDVVLTSHQNDSRLHRTLFLICGGQGLSIKDTVPISDYEGAVFLKLAYVWIWLVVKDWHSAHLRSTWDKRSDGVSSCGGWY